MISEQQDDRKENHRTQFYVVEHGTSVYSFINLALQITGSYAYSDYCNAYTCLKFIFLLFYIHLLQLVMFLNIFNSLLLVYILM
jgi:hypothetical protein